MKKLFKFYKFSKKIVYNRKERKKKTCPKLVITNKKGELIKWNLNQDLLL